MASVNGRLVFPSGIEVPTMGVAPGTSQAVNGSDQWAALLELVQDAGPTLNGAIELKIIEECYRVLKGRCTVMEFFGHNVRSNDNLTNVQRRFLQETLDYLGGGHRTISAAAYYELCNMDYRDVHYVTSPADRGTRLTYPVTSIRNMIVTWSSRSDGLLDMLWTFRAWFGPAA